MNLINSNYYTAFSKSNSLEDDFSEEVFLQSLQNFPRYHIESLGYHETPYQEFISCYPEQSASELLITKLKAIPQSLFCGLIKTIYYFTGALFSGLRDMWSGESLAFKANLFRAGRNFEASFGHFISLFNDRLGAYYVQRSNFYITCYDQFYKAIETKQRTLEIVKQNRLEKEKLVDNEFYSESIAFLVTDREMDLESAKPENTMQRHTLAILTKVNQKIEEYKKSGFPDFSKRLKDFCEAQLNVIEQIKVKEFLETPVEQSPLLIYLMSKEDLEKMTIKEFKKLNASQKKALFAQMKSVRAPDSEQHSEIKNPIDIQDLPLRFFNQLTAKEIELCKYDIPHGCLFYLSEQGVSLLQKLHSEWNKDDSKE